MNRSVQKQAVTVHSLRCGVI